MKGSVARRIGHVLVAAGYLLIVFAAAGSGGFHAPILAWLYAIPVAAAVLVGLRAGWLWAALALAATAVFWTLPSGASDPVSAEDHSLLELVNRTTVILALAGLTTAFAVSRRGAERRLRDTNAALAREARERREGEEEARASDRAKSAFLATMSHEIRTPMNAVVGMTGLLLTTRLSSEQREYAATIRQSGHSLLGIINEILDFSRIEAGHLELDAIDFDLLIAVEEVAELLAPIAHEKGLELVVWADEVVPAAVRGDLGHLRQVLSNLLSNAVKFTEQGEVVIRLRQVRRTIDSVEIRLEVADTGIGIDAQRVEMLFKPFSEASRSTIGPYGGTGLGLAIAKRLCELMGGTIGVDSTPLEGSTFWFTVRLEPGTEAGTSTIPPEIARLKVLVVDDHPMCRSSLGSELLRLGIHSEAAGGAASALAMLRAAAAEGEPFDVALIDLHMPDPDGYGLAREMAAEKDLAATRRVAVIPLGRHDRREEDRRSMFAAALTKPVRRAAVIETLAKLAGLGGRPESGVEEAPESPTAGEIAVGRILVAEDNLSNQRLLELMLGNLGYRVDLAANGREAVEAAGKRTYGAILMDCQMPEMDGYAATESIRRREHASQRVPIIALTANAMVGDRERTLAVGMDDYLAKPVTLESLSTTLGKWCGIPEAPLEEMEALVGGDGPGLAAEKLSSLPGASMFDTGTLPIFSEFVGSFLDMAPQQIEELKEAYSLQDAEGVRLAAHTLKGSCSFLGIESLTAACLDMEEAGRTNTLDGRRDVLDRIETDLSALRRDLLEEPRAPAD